MQFPVKLLSFWHFVCVGFKLVKMYDILFWIIVFCVNKRTILTDLLEFVFLNIKKDSDNVKQVQSSENKDNSGISDEMDMPY